MIFIAKMSFDEEGLLDEPCLSCEKAYTEDIWWEWCCDEQVCKYKEKNMTREEAQEFLTKISYALGNMSVEYLTEKDGEKMREAIMVLKQPRWIPVSERLPGEDICEALGPVWNRKVLITGYCSWDSKKDAFVGVASARDVKNNSIPVTVIAWMPYPEIYKESEDSK